MLGPCARSIGAEELHGLIELECEQEARPHGCGGLIRLEGVGVEMPEIDMQGTGHSSVMEPGTCLAGCSDGCFGSVGEAANGGNQDSRSELAPVLWVLRVQALGEIAVLESHTEEARAEHKSEMSSWEAG